MPTDCDKFSDGELGSAPIAPEMLAVWKTEIREFFSATSEKLSKFHKAGDSQESSHKGSLEMPSPKPSHEKVCATAFGSPSPVNLVGAEDDSADRLQAIKTRLAAQLENASR